MGDFAYLDIVILAAIAIFIAYRLWSVLGQRTGTERPPESLRGRGGDEGAAGSARGQVIPLPTRNPPGEPTGADPAPTDAAPTDVSPKVPGLLDLQLADRSFDPEGFLKGARWAYELILQAFAKGDENGLRPLLADEMFARFAAMIAERRQQGLSVETTLVGLKAAAIEAVDLQGRQALVTVRFTADLISVTRDGSGRVVEGHPTAVREVIDLWTFTRDVRSSDPNWTLTATRAGA